MDRIRLKVLGLSYSMSQAGAYALILADEQDMHRIPIVIGMPEAQSIAIQLEKMQTQRPLTHDLIKKLADALQVTLKEAFIYRLDSGIFYSELLFEKDTQQIKIDSRTSDAIWLCVMIVLFILRLKLWKRPVLRSVRKQDRPNPPKKKRSCNNPIPFRN